jgi:hypothetical protein
MGEKMLYIVEPGFLTKRRNHGKVTVTIRTSGRLIDFD